MLWTISYLTYTKNSPKIASVIGDLAMDTRPCIPFQFNCLLTSGEISLRIIALMHSAMLSPPDDCIYSSYKKVSMNNLCSLKSNLTNFSYVTESRSSSESFSNSSMVSTGIFVCIGELFWVEPCIELRSHFI